MKNFNFVGRYYVKRDTRLSKAFGVVNASLTSTNAMNGTTMSGFFVNDDVMEVIVRSNDPKFVKALDLMVKQVPNC